MGAIFDRNEMWPSDLEALARVMWVTNLGRCCDRYLRQHARIPHAPEHAYIGEGARAELARRAALEA